MQFLTAGGYYYQSIGVMCLATSQQRLKLWMYLHYHERTFFQQKHHYGQNQPCGYCGSFI